MSVKLNSSGGGSVTLQEPTTASNFTLTLPAQTATVITDSSAILNIGSGQIYKDASGNVAIGSTSASGRLHVRQDQDGTTRSILQNRNSSGTPLVELDFITGAVDLSDNRYAYIQSGGGSSQYIAFGTGQGGSPTERARIDSSGNWYMNSGYGSVAIAYGCRAWVRYDGNAQSLIASGNVSSVTYSGTGNYYVNLSTAMPDANYSINLGRCTLNATQPGADGTLMVALSSATANWIGTADQATTGFRLRFGTTGSSFFNTSYVSAAIFR